MLFLPGTLCTPAVFEFQIIELANVAPRIDVLRFTAQDSISKMADLAIDQIRHRDGAAIIGFSMGGMVAMEIARKTPQLVKKLALLNTNFHADLNDRKAAREKYLELAKLTGMENVIRHSYLESYLHKPTKGAEDLIVKMACELGIECFEAQSKALSERPDSTATLLGIKCPTLILSGTQDRLCSTSTQTEMQQMIENSELVMLQDCGHFSILEQPDMVNDALRKWYLES